MKSVIIKRGSDKRLRAGHPWVFSNEIKSPLRDHAPGDMVRLLGAGGQALGVGYINPQSLIAVRVLSSGGAELEEDFIARRLADALRYRETLYPGSDVYRAVYGESDFLPGLIVDRYGTSLVIQVLTAGMDRLKSLVMDAIVSLYAPDAVIARNDTPYRALEGLPGEKSVLYGEWDGTGAVVIEGMEMRPDLLDGQKTGLYLDQRDNLSALDPWAPGARVLDCFCYAGAWGIRALLKGASEVTAVDSSEKALADARENARRNRVDDRWRAVRGDAFEILDALKGGPLFDAAVVDPPAFVRRKDRLASAKRRYREINRKAIGLLRPGGILVSCSCSHHLDRSSFRQLLNEAAAKEGRRAVLVEGRTQSRDHPILLAARETDYLKCFVLRIL